MSTLNTILNPILVVAGVIILSRELPRWAQMVLGVVLIILGLVFRG